MLRKALKVFIEGIQYSDFPPQNGAILLENPVFVVRSVQMLPNLPGH